MSARKQPPRSTVIQGAEPSTGCTTANGASGCAQAPVTRGAFATACNSSPPVEVSIVEALTSLPDRYDVPLSPRLMTLPGSGSRSKRHTRSSRAVGFTSMTWVPLPSAVIGIVGFHPLGHPELTSSSDRVCRIFVVPTVIHDSAAMASVAAFNGSEQAPYGTWG